VCDTFLKKKSLSIHIVCLFFPFCKKKKKSKRAKRDETRVSIRSLLALGNCIVALTKKGA